MASIEDRLARLEAIEAIKLLKARYCALCDDDYDPEGIADLFVPGGVWDGGTAFGRHVGQEAIMAFFRSISGTISFAAHLVLNPMIDVQGPALAIGKWRLIMPCTVATPAGAEARWLLSEYDEVYARVGDAWKFRSLALTVNFFAPHLAGWAGAVRG